MITLRTGVITLSGALGTTGASLAGHQLIAISTLAVTFAAIAGELWIAKRRDDVFRRIAARRKPDPDILRALTIHEAVRSGLLSSQDAFRLLRDGSDDPGDCDDTAPLTKMAPGSGKGWSRDDPFGTMGTS